MSLFRYSWGVNQQERLLDFPCDSLIEPFDDTYHIGISIKASPEIIFRGLCQLRVTTYAFGHNDSPCLKPGLDTLVIGQTVMEFFEIVSFVINKHLTIRTKKGTRESKIYGDVAVSYVIIPKSEYQCRLLVRCHIKYPKILGILLRFVLPWGDLIMMRIQLQNIKKLSEQMQKRQAA
jgi:hypothetical protein